MCLLAKTVMFSSQDRGVFKPVRKCLHFSTDIFFRNFFWRPSGGRRSVQPLGPDLGFLGMYFVRNLFGNAGIGLDCQQLWILRVSGTMKNAEKYFSDWRMPSIPVDAMYMIVRVTISKRNKIRCPPPTQQ